eukprot:TRINITY_DN1834_c0_g2_i1.p1 TRINITY_DN1834_c0_g2~~TRINITY_DN1834_c0_g2_i1.p1  ORF type:complete len:268 (+),score=43.55 TRINITY_DN1834_c0_g2_i1:333-1136(+)
MTFSALFVLPTQVYPSSSRLKSSLFLYPNKPKRRNRSIVPVARLFGPAIFEASKLKVLFLGVDEEKHPGNLPRTYTLTHSDITSKLTLAISQTINRAQLQGWYNRLQRDEVVAEWKKVQDKMSLHVHCHISGGHLFLDFIAKLRHYIFSKELPVVLKAFVHGDGNLFNTYPELEEALVWVYFHSSLKEFNSVECWGPLKDAAEGVTEVRKQFFSSSSSSSSMVEKSPKNEWVMPLRCPVDCTCCFPPMSLIPWPHDLEEATHNRLQQ